MPVAGGDGSGEDCEPARDLLSLRNAFGSWDE